MTHIYYAPQDDWGPEQFYSLYRYLDRMFSSRKSHRLEEIASLDLERMTPETRYLMRHLLVLQGGFRAAMIDHPNLRGLMEASNPTLPIVLREPPRGTYDYFTRHGILL